MYDIDSQTSGGIVVSGGNDAVATPVKNTATPRKRSVQFGDVFQGSCAMVIRVDDFYKWIDFLCAMDEQADAEGCVAGIHRYPRKWVFRGQANASWNIRSSFEVSLDELPQEIKKEPNFESLLREKERRTYLEFRRFGHAHVQGFDKMNFPEWLTYMQHFGVKTRMVDFTESPLTALYFSQEDKREKGEFAVWGVCISALSPYEDMPEFKKLKECSSATEKHEQMPGFIKSLFKTQACTSGNVAEQWHGACKIFDYMDESFEQDEQIFYFYPRWNNERASAQSGLFLMPSHLSVPFHTILMRGCSTPFKDEYGVDVVLHHQKYAPDQIAAHLRVVKFVFGADLREKVTRVLKLMDKNPRTIYPGIYGLARSLERPMDVK